MTLRYVAPVLAAVVGLVGCPGPAKKPSTAHSHCPRGAIAAQDGLCRCRSGRFAAGPACTSFQEAQSYCGPGATVDRGTCVTRGCKPGDALDLDSGDCLPPATLQTLARAQGIDRGGGATFQCSPGGSLVVESQALRCLPSPAMCSRGWRWDEGKKQCVPTRRCAAGELADPARERCVRVVTTAGDEDVLDVGAWLAVAIGPYGGNGSPDFCGMLARSPGRLGRTASGASSLRVHIEIDFPANEVSAARLRFRASDLPADHLLSGQAERAVERAISSLLDPLRALAGVTSSATVETRVVCTVGDHGLPFAGP